MEEDTTPNISSMSNQELRDLIDELTAEEQEVSYRRRILHGRIDLLRANWSTASATRAPTSAR